MSPTEQEKIPFWNNPKNRSWVFQIIIFSFVLGTAYFLFSNTQENLQRQNIAAGFEFLSQEAGFEISESVVEYYSDDTYKKALIAGVVNTLKVAFFGNILAILLGIFVGISCLSNNWLVSKISRMYIEIIRNIPLLLQLFFWYALFSESFPGIKQALNPITGVFISNRGLVFGIPKEHAIHSWMWGSLFIGILSCYGFKYYAKKRKEKTGKEFPLFFVNLSLIIGLPLLTWLIGGAPTEMDIPILRGFNFRGGYTLTPEFVSLMLGLVLYTAAFNAEIVRSGIQSVKKGQWEAARALGLNEGKVLRLVILPQALRVIIPPLTSQLLNLTKNSSLAVAIAYPDFVAVVNTVMNQTGQAVEGVFLIMLVYLVFSLSTSLLMNLYNKKVALVER